ncbi:MAG: tRNA uridine(34) 5-carboxymethylaminomethyl modification radical SAM/GNAT enzyme Elp3 [Candidatus Nealsonbacteria bacterium]|nr:tRNA uridine(34) 5-carboxymethylaminomethyl modification radical SAM/GNAT enzyme Elp3 [Candidatus Nealsonbacteria bacterium]
MNNFNENIIRELIKVKADSPPDLASAKRKISKENKSSFPTNISLLKTYHELLRDKSIGPSEKIEGLLKTRPVRSLSGIVNVAVLTKPYPCPGKCIFCPTEKGIPKSYLSGEPAVERAKRLHFDPYLQVKKRIEMLENEGHPTDKIELRIIGGTWSFYPKKYQEWFIKKCFDACLEKNAENLKIAQRLNEKARHRIIGVSIETRPDFINEKEIKHLRDLGITMVELGVQSTYNDVLKSSKRGHGIKKTIKATKLLKDAGFKILYQMMLNLPESSPKRDEKMFEELFSNPDFQPDLLKIYPCALLKEAPLYKQWKKGKFHPYKAKQLEAIVKAIKKKIPYYVRIQRITRDIPSQRIAAGATKISNLRQTISGQSMCRCIRCREIKEKYDRKEKVFLFKQEYPSSDGKEIFLSLENKERTKLYSLIRLRLSSEGKAIIRELHTYGQLVSIGKGLKSNKSAQHKGMGKKLIKEAEKIAKKEFKVKKIAIISGVGARGYYRKLGYKLEDTYMVKNI